MKKWYWYLIAATWALPVALFSFISTGIFLAAGQLEYLQREGVIFEFTVKKDGWFYDRFWKGRWAGVCMGLTIWYADGYHKHERTVKHERRHAMQCLALGIFQPIAYIGHSLYLWVFRRDLHAYHNNFFEEDARREAGQKVKLTKDDWMDGPEDRWPWW